MEHPKYLAAFPNLIGNFTNIGNFTSKISEHQHPTELAGLPIGIILLFSKLTVRPHPAAIARLQLIAKKVLPKCQCGFRKGRGCINMIFTVRQLFEKSREHDEFLFVLFVDLCKAHDSVSRGLVAGIE